MAPRPCRALASAHGTVCCIPCRRTVGIALVSKCSKEREKTQLQLPPRRANLNAPVIFSLLMLAVQLETECPVYSAPRMRDSPEL
eukprot:1195955-Prorocentrum_minimum.AAC.5